MAAAASIPAPRRSSGGRKTALIAVGAIALYFVYQYTLRYFVWSEDVYGYYWQYRLPLIAHVGGGLVALLMGVFQLWSGLNSHGMTTPTASRGALARSRSPSRGLRRRAWRCSASNAATSEHTDNG